MHGNRRRRRMGGGFSIGERARLSGKNIVNSAGTPLTLRGPNQGTWLEDYEPDAANILATGANFVRIVFVRWWGDSYEAGIDMYDSSASNNYLNPTRWAAALNKIRWASAQGLWINAVFDSDNGAGNRGLLGANSNFFEATGDGPAKLAEWKAMQRYVIGQLLNFPRILSIELLAEPLPVGSDATWAATLRNFYLDLIANARTVDPITPFVIGPRASYGLNNLNEILLAGRTDIIYTWDSLTNKTSAEGTIADNVEVACAFRDTNNVPIYSNQLGRNTSDDIGDINADAIADTTENIGLTAMNGAQSVFNARGVPYSWWQWHQNTDSPTAYAIYYKTVYPGSGPNNWTVKPGELASLTYHMTQTLASVDSAAEAAATASSSALWYIKSDFSNVFQDDAGATPVTAVGQTVGRWVAVVGGRVWTQTNAALRPTLVATVNGYALQFAQASNHTLALDQTYFTATGNALVGIACRPNAGTTIRTLFQTGTSGTAVRSPYLSISASDNFLFSNSGDDAVRRDVTSVTTCDNRAVVVTGTRVGDNKNGYVQGVIEGTPNGTAIGSIATITRTRLGASSAGTNGFDGIIATVFICNGTWTDEQRRAMARQGAYRIGAPFRGAIPA